MTCPSRAQWQAVLSQDCPEGDEAAFFQHAESCSACQELLETLTGPQGLSLARRVHAGQDTPLPTAAETPPQAGKQAQGDPYQTADFRSSDARDDPVMSSVSIPGYELLSELGHGGMGVVYKARHLELGRVVALKMMRAGSAADREMLDRFRGEAQLIARLQHPGIVQIHEIGTLEGQPYLALEYVAGSSLDKKLRGQPQPPREAAALLIPIAEAMQAAHERGIIHRDLKPANILLAQKSATNTKDQNRKSKTPPPAVSDFAASDFGFVSDLRVRISDFHPKVTDFGLAKPLDEDSGRTQTGVVMGTPSYMAPEQAAGRKNLGPAVDIYALGALFYEMLTGQPPFKGVTSYDTVHLVLHEEPVPPRRLQPQVPRDLETICLKCLEKEPGKRYLTAQDVAEEARRFLEGKPILARPVGRVERTWKWCRRYPAVAALLVVATVAAVVSTLLASWALRAEQDARRESEQAKVQRDSAVREWQRAETNFAQARKAVDSSFLICKEHELFQDEAMRPQRHLLLALALPFYRDFVRQKSDDPVVLAEQADLLLHLAHIYGEIGPRENAVSIYQEVLAIYHRLMDLQPQVIQHQRELARTLNGLGTVQQHLGRLKDALASFVHSRQVLESLANAQPHHQDDRPVLARTLYNLGIIHRALGQPTEALACFTSAREMQETLVTAQPTNLSHGQDLAETCSSLGILHDTLEQTDAALACYVRARQVWKILVAARPDVGIYRHGLARTWSNLGLLLHHRLGRISEAAASYGEAQRLQEHLLLTYPRTTRYAVMLGGTCCNLGSLESARNRIPEALRQYTLAIGLLQQVLRREPSEAAARQYLRNAYGGRGETLSGARRWTAGWQDYRRALALSQGRLVRVIEQRMAKLQPLAQAEQVRLLALANSLTARGGAAILLGELVPWLSWMAPEALDNGSAPRTGPDALHWLNTAQRSD